MNIFHNEEIYILGGRTYGSDDEAILNSCEKYNLKSKKWIDLPKMNVNRCTSFVFVWNERIYVLGGYTGPYERDTKIEFLNEKNN